MKLYFFSYERHVNAIPSEGHQALPKSRRGREREGEKRGKGRGEGREKERKGKGEGRGEGGRREGEGGGEGISVSEDIHRKRVANSVTVFKGSVLGHRQKERSPKKENKGL